MSKHLVLGNGSVLVGLDEYARIKDLYYDYVGLENHLTPEAVCKIGIWVEDQFSWFDDGSWQFRIDYEKETLQGNISAVNNNLNLEILFTDLVYNEKPIVIRNIEIKNKEKREREVRLFLNHQFRMYGMHKKDSVFWDPRDETIVHYKGRRIALIGGDNNGKSFDDWSVGLSYIEGKEGTWRDAEDGVLTKNPIEHGTVDSTVSFNLKIDSGASEKVSYWICLGKKQADVKELHSYIKKKSSAHLTETNSDYWHAWVNKTDFSFYGIDKKVVDLFKRSLLIVRTHVDNTGGVLASGDSQMLQYGRDNYSYIWHRDGAFVAMALDKAGYSEVARKFYEFSVETITEEGYFFHKYRPDKSLGSSWHGWLSPDGKPRIPIQEDETAILLTALWEHYSYTKDIEFVENIYNPLIKKASEFMIKFRNEKHLPEPSFDLWEQRWGIHTFTASAVYSALVCASHFAELLGKEDDQVTYMKAANDMRTAILKNMHSSDLKFFYKYIDFDGKDILHDETIDASSFYGLFRFGVLEPDDKELKESFETFKEKLCCHTDIGGVARFEGDIYYKVTGQYPGNPWIVTSLWLAQYYIQSAKKEQDMAEVHKLLGWVADRAMTSGILPEQVNPYSGVGMSAAPLTWSHAEFVTTVISYLEKLESLGVCKVYYPVDQR